MAINSDYSNMMNQQRLNSMNSLFGGMNNSTVGPLSGDLIQAWQMRGANGAAYRKLLEAQETGSIKPKDPYKYELMSDKYYNDEVNYDPKTGKITYTPEKVTTAEDGDLLSQLDSMKNLAQAAAANPGAINDNYANLFNTLRQNIANALVTKSGSNTSEGPTTEAQAAKVTSKVDFRYLSDDQTFTVAGKDGEKTYSFSAGTSLDKIAEAINADSETTGVKAEVVTDSEGNVTDISLLSTAAGKDAFVRVDQTAGEMFTSVGASTSARGVDATESSSEVVARGGDAKAALATGVYGGVLSGDQEFVVSGANGSKTFSFAGGTSVEDVVAAINDASEQLGVTATAIRNSTGQIEGLGLESNELGQNQSVRVEQKKGYLFTAPGQSVGVYGKSESPDGANVVNSLSQFGKINWGGQTYSFADLGPGGKVSLDETPDIAMAIIDQAIQDVYSGAAELKGVDMEEAILERPYVPVEDKRVGSSPQNALAVNDYGSTALANWIAERLVEK